MTIQLAVEILQKGGLVAIPTETVYGLGADASNPDALRKIFKAKGRPADHPLIVHIGSVDQLSAWARDIPEIVYPLAKQFWPGPLTLILKKAVGVSDLITGGQDTIGIRIPNHPVALELLRAFGGGIAAPSANKFGRISPTTAEAVREELGESVELILEGGQCEVGVESTILDLSGDTPRILRPGMITHELIEKVIGQAVLQADQHSPRVSGSLESHYAPTTPLIILPHDEIIPYLKNAPVKAVVLAREKFADLNCVLMPHDVAQYAHELYKVLREVDAKQYEHIIVEKNPETAEWEAVNDRLKRASSVV